MDTTMLADSSYVGHWPAPPPDGDSDALSRDLYTAWQGTREAIAEFNRQAAAIQADNHLSEEGRSARLDAVRTQIAQRLERFEPVAERAVEEAGIIGARIANQARAEAWSDAARSARQVMIVQWLSTLNEDEQQRAVLVARQTGDKETLGALAHLPDTLRALHWPRLDADMLGKVEADLLRAVNPLQVERKDALQAAVAALEHAIVEAKRKVGIQSDDERARLVKAA